MLGPIQQTVADWTALHGVCNSSPEFCQMAAEISQLLRERAHDLMAGRSLVVAREIVARLAHEHGMAPRR